MKTPEAPFEAPWQAQLFALTVAMNENGMFTWTEWARVFGPRVQHAPATAYWEVWAEALETLLEENEIAERSTIETVKRQWQEAAGATPHGQPILLISNTR